MSAGIYIPVWRPNATFSSMPDFSKKSHRKQHKGHLMAARIVESGFRSALTWREFFDWEN